MKKIIVMFILLVFCVACTNPLAQPTGPIEEKEDNSEPETVTLFEGGKEINESSEGSYKKTFDEIYSELQKLKSSQRPESPNQYRLSLGDRYIETIESGEKETWTVVSLSEDADKNEPAKFVEKDSPLYKKIMSLIEEIEAGQ